MMTDLKDMAREELDALLKSREVLVWSVERCRKLAIEPGMTFESLDAFEALTSRFARSSDLVIQRMLRTVDALELEADGTVRDRLFRAEKRGIIEDARLFVEIRQMRNIIAHENRSETILEIFETVLELAPALIAAMDNLEIWLTRRLSEPL